MPFLRPFFPARKAIAMAKNQQRPDSNPYLTVFGQSESRLKLFVSEMQDEHWKADHLDAMSCLSFEETLRTGVEGFEFLMKLDESAQEALLSPEVSDAERRAYHGTLNSLLRQWLEPCASVERQIAIFEAKGYKIELAAKFRSYRAEAEWILTPDADKFARPEFDELREKAVSDLRSGKCVE